MSGSKNKLPEWELVLSSAARLQRLIPEAVLVGGTASALHAEHRFSRDADHVLTDLRSRFDEVLAQLESVAGWQTARINRPVQILRSLDGIETGIRQLIRQAPLETTEVRIGSETITVPTANEILRVKGVLILKRNATRDYLDFAALSEHLGEAASAEALATLDALYPQVNGQSALQQLHVQLASAQPYDLEEVNLAEYKMLTTRYHDWAVVTRACARMSALIFQQLCRPSGASEDPDPERLKPRTEQSPKQG